jgi:hypothetical protein
MVATIKYSWAAAQVRYGLRPRAAAPAASRARAGGVAAATRATAAAGSSQGLARWRYFSAASLPGVARGPVGRWGR